MRHPRRKELHDLAEAFAAVDRARSAVLGLPPLYGNRETIAYDQALKQLQEAAERIVAIGKSLLARESSADNTLSAGDLMYLEAATAEPRTLPVGHAEAGCTVTDPEKVEHLVQQGLLERRREYWFVITDKGREVLRRRTPMPTGISVGVGVANFRGIKKLELYSTDPLVRAAREILFPDGNLEHECGSEELGKLVNLFMPEKQDGSQESNYSTTEA